MYEHHICDLRIELSMKAIFAVVKIRLEQKFRPVRDLNP